MGFDWILRKQRPTQFCDSRHNPKTKTLKPPETPEEILVDKVAKDILSKTKEGRSMYKEMMNGLDDVEAHLKENQSDPKASS